MLQAHVNTVAMTGRVYLLNICYMPNLLPSTLDIVLIYLIFAVTVRRKYYMYLNDNVTKSLRNEGETALSRSGIQIEQHPAAKAML